MVAGFNVWNIWKERNGRIFQKKISNPEEVWQRTLRQIRELILAEVWTEENWKTSEEEAEILRRLNLEQGMVFQQKKKQQQPIAAQSLAVFRRPQEGFIKLNFDRATKGNPGPTGYGGIFRNSQGDT